jgi:hypothetical protein
MGIKHFSSLYPEKFLDVLYRISIKDPSIKTSIKIDGSVNLGFGVDENGELYFDRIMKNSSYRRKWDEFPKTPEYNAIRVAASTIKNWIQVKIQFPRHYNVEVYIRDFKNVCSYKNNMIVFLDDFIVNPFDSLINSDPIDVYMYDSRTDDIEKFEKIYTFELCSKTYIQLDTEMSISACSIGLGHLLNSETEKNEEKIQNCKDEICKILYYFNYSKFSFGAELAEGIVIEDSKNNECYKITNNFSDINSFFWMNRELISEGSKLLKINGIEHCFRREISELLNFKLLNSPITKYKLRKMSEAELTEFCKKYIFIEEHVKEFKYMCMYYLNDLLIHKRHFLQEGFIREILIENQVYKLDNVTIRKTLECYKQKEKNWNKMIEILDNICEKDSALNIIKAYMLL